ncbi:CPBP family intramembrane glutamic endopeptidase [Sandarakinorhabdus oryzae]|uniref:CPBP family intramembrane glutamic endopeptidase n=1 Tax=Sandarakinorhabdus oryzae TaxID=2675220 RepID=UPI0012E1C483|nr:CPBP family intramembrane glutamic endopeptidase [Sandarakinorhabdus oryzae]
MTARARLGIAIAAVAVWAGITVWVGVWQAGHGALGDLVSRQVNYASPLAALFLLLVCRGLRWNDVGLNGPRPAASVWLLWPIALYIAVFAGVALLTQKPAMPALAFIAINTAFVGLSEELAFRGVLWGAARKALAFWPGVLLVSALFGSIHLLNVFITGQLGDAAIQALNAFLSGFGYLALRVRTRSLLPMIVGHWLWDLAVFLGSADPNRHVAGGGSTSLLYAAALVAPIALYGLWLLRKPEYRDADDSLGDASAKP